MAKTAVKESTPTKTSTKSVGKPKATALSIESVVETIHAKLVALELAPALQADIAWCLGSYRHDGNPVGLYEMASQALTILKAEQAKKTKGITAKLISDIEKTLASFK
ncbi:MAG: hypothetical protein MUC38_15540 [Cyclobacteriaceae bacterium]|jgi:hypothetical protein|nr:hypothetical protein [Cyclobacteriaceae bacterium]